MPKPIARTVPQARLSPALRASMWALFARYYEDVTEETFLKDLKAKDHVILLTVEGRLVGFSTLKRLRGPGFVAVFSGDTIVDCAYWGQTALQRAFLAYVVKTRLAHPLVPVWWFLISKGFKTYLLLTRNFPEHWPRHDRPTPAPIKALIDHLAASLYPTAYRPTRGIIEYEPGHGRLKETVAPVSEALLARPDVRFFAEQNPHHAQGEELCCLGRVGVGLAASYLTKLARRALRQRTP